MTNARTPRRRMPRRALAAVCLLAIPAAAVSACGGGDSVPGNAVAKVGDAVIKKETFDHWMRIAAISSQGQTQGASPAAAQIPQPPDYKACIDNKKKTAPKP